MEWPRVKTILIVVLLIVNIFLFVAYASSALRETRDEEQVRLDVCEILGNLGYKLDPEILPGNSELLYPAQVLYNAQSEREAMTATLGRTETESAAGITVYTGSTGQVTLRNGGFVDARIALSDGLPDRERAVRMVERTLRDMRILLASGQVSETGDALTVDGVCSLAGVPVFDCRVKAVVSQAEGIVISGRAPAGDVNFLQSAKPRALSGLMLNFAQHMQSLDIHEGTISEIQRGYVINTSANAEGGTVELAPVWRVCMDGENWFVNALTGKVMALH